MAGHTSQITTLNQAVSDLDAGKAKASTVTALQTTVAGKASQASLDNLSSTVSTLSTSTSSQITSLQTQVNDVSASVKVGAVATTAPSGASSAWMVTVKTDTAGTIATGGIMIGVFGTGSTRESRLYLQADKTYVMNGNATAALLTLSGGNVYLNGNLIANGSITAAHLSVATLDAISGNFGTMTAGKIQSASGKFVIDLDNGYIEGSD